MEFKLLNRTSWIRLRPRWACQMEIFMATTLAFIDLLKVHAFSFTGPMRQLVWIVIRYLQSSFCWLRRWAVYFGVNQKDSLFRNLGWRRRLEYKSPRCVKWDVKLLSRLYWWLYFSLHRKWIISLEFEEYSCLASRFRANELIWLFSAWCWNSQDSSAIDFGALTTTELLLQKSLIQSLLSSWIHWKRAAGI